MSGFKRFGKWALVVALTLMIGVSVITLFTDVEAKGRCICPKIYAPVKCDNGKVFSNQCVADCRNARNCEPIGL